VAPAEREWRFNEDANEDRVVDRRPPDEMRLATDVIYTVATKPV
jgi:hypothetical protein